MADPVYRANPDAPPDTDFLPGELSLIVAGNRGRLLDARRTPVTVLQVAVAIGMFEVRIDDFEDAGRRWLLPLEDAGRFQFRRDSAGAGQAELTAYAAAVARLDRATAIDFDRDVRARTLARLQAERKRAAAWLADRMASFGVDVAGAIEVRRGDGAIQGLLVQWLGGAAEMDRAFSETFVSNPRSGELVKGHAIVLAELGLCPYRGRVIRDPSLFHGPWSRMARAEHLLRRLAFTQALWERLGHPTVQLYRAVASETALQPPRAESFVSATFSATVAAAHFQGGPATRVAAMWRALVPTSRLLMTFLETEAMNGRYAEAEAILIGDPSGDPF